jgi:hypothetical protein
MTCILLAVALYGCGGGDSGSSADTMTVTISGPSGTTTTTYVEGTYNAQGYLDPDLSSFVTTSLTRIDLISQVSSTQPTGVKITVLGATAQTYPAGQSAIFYYTNNQSYDSLISNTSCTVTLSSIGNVGEKITGTFDAVVSLLTNTYDTVRISGTFSVMRDD